MLFVSLISGSGISWSSEYKLGSTLQSHTWMLAHVEEHLAISATQSFMWGGFAEGFEWLVKMTSGRVLQAREKHVPQLQPTGSL